MALNAAVIMPPLQQVIFDKTLQTFLAGGRVFFFEDANRTIPKNVYELTGTGPGSYLYVSLGSELTLSGIGSFIDAEGGNIPIYLWPFTGTPNDNPPSETIQNYYITVYSSTGVFQFDIPNWPGITANASPINTADTTDNIISNPQFVDVTFPSTFTAFAPFNMSITGTNTVTEIAPDWSLVTSGSGSVGVWQQQISDDDVPGNPPFAIGITTSGFTQPTILRQRILSPRIFANQFVSATFIAASQDGSAHTLSLTYTPSITGTIQTICTGTTLDSGFTIINNPLPIQIVNPGNGTGFVDISIVIPVGASVLISCVQLCGVAGDMEVVAFLEQTPEREVDHLFHYFQPQLNFKPIPSLLTGWDFPLNPRQFGSVLTPVSSFSTTPIYVWDQTICASAVSTVNVAATTQGNFNATTTTNVEAFYMLQYLSGFQAFETAINDLSVNIFSMASASNVVVKVYLFYGNLSSSIPILPTTIGAINNTGAFTLSALNWNSIGQAQGYASTATLSQNVFTDIGFTGWNNATNYLVSQNFAIVVTFAIPTSGTSVNVQSISCVPGHIPTRPAPLTADEVLRKCQYYYEKSYNPLAYPGAGTVLGSVVVFQNSELFTAVNVNANFYQEVIPVQFKQVKRVINPGFVAYSISGTINKVTGFLNGLDSGNNQHSVALEITLGTYWAGNDESDSYVCFIPVIALLGVDLISIAPTATTGFIGTSAWVQFHYTLDARLGVI